jgi:hypothetical protein
MAGITGFGRPPMHFGGCWLVCGGCPTRFGGPGRFLRDVPRGLRGPGRFLRDVPRGLGDPVGWKSKGRNPPDGSGSLGDTGGREGGNSQVT